MPLTASCLDSEQSLQDSLVQLPFIAVGLIRRCAPACAGMGLGSRNPSMPEYLLELKHRGRAKIRRAERSAQILFGVAEEEGAGQHFVAPRYGIEQRDDAQGTARRSTQGLDNKIDGRLAKQYGPGDGCYCGRSVSQSRSLRRP